MIFHILVTVFFSGFALLLVILNVMRGLNAFTADQPPLLPGDPETKGSLDERHKQPHLADRRDNKHRRRQYVAVPRARRTDVTPER